MPPITRTDRNQTYDADGNLIAEEVVEVDITAETNESTIEDRMDLALAAMRAHVTRGTFTSAQRDAAILLLLRVCIGMVRLVRRRFDDVD